MSVDKEIKEKQEQLEKGIIAWQKQKEELAELEARKSNLVREINLQLNDAKAKADKIIGDAQATAKSLVDETEKIRAEATEFSNKTRGAANDISLKAQSETEKAQEAQAQLAKDKDEFDNLKVGQDMDIQDKTACLQNREKELNARQSCLDTLETSLNAKETELDKRDAELKKGEDALSRANERLAFDRAELDRAILTHNQNKEVVENQRLANERVLLEIKTTQDKIATDMKANQDTLDIIAKQNTEIANQKETIKAQFALIKQNQKEQEEKDTALDERTQLIAIRDREVTQKIQILQELRTKSGVQ